MSLFTCGIDLGTTYSCISSSRNGKIDVIIQGTGKRTIPSFVSYADDRILVGEAAKNNIYKNIENTVYDAKRLIGHKFTEAVIQDDIKHWGFKVIPDNNNNCLIEVKYKNAINQLYPQNISSQILATLVESARKNLGENSDKTCHVVITVPAYFNDKQRRDTIEAGELAGLNVLQVINEPTAAAIAYGYKYFKDNKENRRILVYDFGGGTFDVSIIEVKDKKITVKATGGDTHLGGEDINKNILNHYKKQLLNEADYDIDCNKKKKYRLISAIEEAKIKLNSLTETEIESDLLDDNDINSNISRSFFNKLNEQLFQKTITIVKNVLAESELNVKDIDDIVLVGGSSRIPRVQELLSEFFNGKELNKDINPDEAVAYGAALLAEDILQGVKERKRKDGTIELVDIQTDNILNPNDSNMKTYKCSDSKVLLLSKSIFKPNLTVNKVSSPELLLPLCKSKNTVSFSEGGRKAPIERSRNRKFIINDVLSISIGKQNAGDIMSIILEKQTPIPAQNTKLYRTSEDNQTEIELLFYQGDEKKASMNKLLDRYVIDNIPKRKAGMVELAVTMDINENGILTINVTPVDSNDFKSVKLTIQIN